jgi:hypothetical protein
MSLTSKLLSASGGVDKLFSDDVFQAYTRTGTGADAVVTTGIDMTKGYLLWSKGRGGATDHALYDSVRGLTLDLVSNSTAGQTTQTTGLKAVSTTGHTVGSLAKMNTNGATYVDWVSREAPKFFDAVTYTGTGVNRTVPHSLNSEVGTLIVKRTDTAADWQVYHRSAANTEYLVLNSTAAKATGATRWNSTTPTTGSFSLGTDVTVNANGGTYVAYLYAHDTTADSIVKCGSFTTDGSSNVTVDLGWEPQFILYKSTISTGNWEVYDTSRGWSHTGTGGSQVLKANLLDVEAVATSQNERFYPTATGFQAGGAQTSNTSHIYIAIRRSNKPPVVGTEVYNAISRTGTGAAATVTGVGFAPDLVIAKLRAVAAFTYGTFDRLRGRQPILETTTTAAEQTISTVTQDLVSFDMNGISVGVVSNSNINLSSQPLINYFFKHAVGVFSKICYTGSGSNKTEIHNLGSSPDLMIVKSRSSANEWNVWCTTLSGTEKLVLNSTAAKVTDLTAWNSTQPTSSVISLGTSSATNTNAATYVAYLFATNAGISKVFSYTGNGSSQTINCGFTTGARFVMIKRTDSTGDWYVWDSVRGIVASNDPHLSLNTTATEVTTDDSVDPNVLGFDINQNTATNINVTSGTYIGLAFA